MVRTDFLPQKRPVTGRAHVRAFLASCAFHGLLLGGIIGLALLDRAHPPLRSGSTGSPSISLQTLIVLSPPTPAAHVPPTPSPVTPVPAPQAPVAAAPPPQVQATPKPVDQGVPVIAARPVLSPAEPAKPSPVKIAAVSHRATTRHITTAALEHPHASTSLPPSSYAPGANALPHPPYPLEARDLHETGTVIVSVRFDAQGGVAGADVAQSSGVPILDSETKSFIRANWHSASFAGQTVSVPVQYTLQNM